MSNEKTVQLTETAKALVASQRQGSLATVSTKHPAFPFCSLMPYALDGESRPVFLISSLAVHSKNLRNDARVSLLVTADSKELTDARVTMVGKVEPVPDEEIETVRKSYLLRHPEANQWIEFGDFQLVRMSLIDIYLIAGFGMMGWVDVDDYTVS